MTLQGAIDYLDHEFLTNRFHVTHYRWCAILFNKDTFFVASRVGMVMHATGTINKKNEAASYKRSASATLAGTHIANGADPRAGSGPFPKPRTLVLPTSTSCIINTDSVFQWNPGPARRNPTNIIAAACGRFQTRSNVREIETMC